MSRSLEHAICNNIECPMECSTVGSTGYDESNCDRCGSKVTVYSCNDGSWAGMDNYVCECFVMHFETYGEKMIKMNKEDFEQFEWVKTSLDINDGWLNLVHELCTKLDRMVYDEMGDDAESFCTTQIKEKFGGLRFYVSCATKNMTTLIHEYEAKSYSVCELCGNPGHKRPTAWIATLCRTHYLGLIITYVKEFPYRNIDWYLDGIRRLLIHIWDWARH